MDAFGTGIGADMDGYPNPSSDTGNPRLRLTRSAIATSNGFFAGKAGQLW
jgi:hypothetical protein